MATWADFQHAAPQLATKGMALLYQYGAPLGYIATVRPDGGPRVHPFCPIVAEGGLWAFILRHSPKGADLRRDPVSRFTPSPRLTWTTNFSCEVTLNPRSRCLN
jgi:hypothetical protein